MKQPSNAQLRRWSKLRQRKHRENEQLFIAEGERCVSQILENNAIHVEALIVREGEESTGLISGLYSGRATERVPVRGVDLYTLSSGEFHRLSDTSTPQGVLAVCKIPDEVSVGSLSEDSGIIIATDAIQDPGNFGTMVRTAAWFGVCGILAGTGSVDPWNPKVVRSTAGATGSVPVVGGDLKSLLALFETAGWDVLLLEGGDESEPLTGISHESRTVVVVGNEGEGIQKGLFKPGRKPVRIPCRNGAENRGGVESLNAATALGIALFQLGR